MTETHGFSLLRPLGLETTIVDLVSPLRREECVRRLREHVDAWPGLYGTRSVIGQIGETAFTLRQRVGYRNSFRTVLRGTFVDESRSTRLHCRSGVQPFARIFILFWLAAVLAGACAIGLPVVWALVEGTHAQTAKPVGVIFVPLLMFCFGIVLTKGGRRMARGEHQYLVEFLGKQLDARAAPTAEG
jgi:hypothetical protein